MRKREENLELKMFLVAKCNLVHCKQTENFFSQQKEIQRQQKIIEDLEEIITKIRRVCTPNTLFLIIPSYLCILDYKRHYSVNINFSFSNPYCVVL